MKPNDKAYQAAIAEGKRWREGLSRRENQIPSWKVLRQDGENGAFDVVAEFNNHKDRDEALERLRAEAMVSAAYAAQFQSEDYAKLIKDLHAFSNECEGITIYAADALSSTLAERDEWKGRQEATAAILKRIEVERDALKDELVKARSVDMTWFWEIVDANGLNNVASFEQTALRELVRDSAILNGLKAQFGDIGKGDGQFTVKSTFQSLLNVIDFNVELAGKLTAAEKERDAALAEIDAISSAIKSPRYMDPPDGGSVTIAEQVARMWEDNEALRTERDALLARLAPVEASTDPLTNGMTVAMPDGEEKRLVVAPAQDEALMDIAVETWIEATTGLARRPSAYTISERAGARAAIAAIRPHIEAAERERCARIADKHEGEWRSSTADACAFAIAAAIRNGK